MTTVRYDLAITNSAIPIPAIRPSLESHPSRMPLPAKCHTSRNFVLSQNIMDNSINNIITKLVINNLILNLKNTVKK